MSRTRGVKDAAAMKSFHFPIANLRKANKPNSGEQESPQPARTAGHCSPFHTPCSLQRALCQRRCTVRTETLKMSAVSA
jgi:hypothetical protein